MKRSLLVSILLLACSSPSSPTTTPSAAQTLARVARFPELRLIADGALERAADGVHLARGEWKLLGGLDVTVSDATTRLALDDAAWIELSTHDRRSTGTISGASFVLSDVAPATDLVHQVNRTRYEEIRVLREPHAPTTTRYRVRLGPGLASLRVVDDRVEVLDFSGRVRLQSAPPFALDDRGERRAVHVRLVGDVLETTLDPDGLSYPIVVDPLWTPTPDMAITRFHHGAAPLPGGKVMIAGGLRASGSASQTNTAVAWDPGTNAFTSLPNLSSGPADSFVLTVLSSGRILKTGGNDGTTPSRNAYVFNPATSTWTDMFYLGGTPYVADIVAPLASDQALALGSDALLFDRAAGTWVAAGTPTVGHSGMTATTISGNRVLVLGGSTVADLWDPTTKTFSAGGTLTVSRSGHTATLLPSGKVLVVGGGGLSSAELYDPATKTFAAAGTMAAARTNHTATLLGDRVFVVGGQNATGVLSTAEIWDPTSNTFSSTASMSVPRVLHTATASGNKVLVVGGWNGSKVHSTAEVFEPYAKGTACTKATDCVSGFCTDGVCCDKACDGTCEACDATGSVGTCSAVTGAPHGARTACTGGTGVCAKTCDGVDRTQCTFPGAAVVCSAATCAAGTATTATSCDGAGSCPTPSKSDCAPYACGASACKTTCTGDGDCGGANVCDTKTGKCVVAAEAKCAPDRASSIPTDTSKPAVPCSPYLCDTTSGKCSTRCVSSADCVGGTACDTASATCLPPKTDEPKPGETTDDSGGGCATGHGPTSGSLVLLLALLGLRRRQQK